MHGPCPPKEEGAGKAGCAVRTRSLACSKKTRELVTTGSPEYPAFPAQWFYGLLRSLPGDRALLPPSSAQCASIVANLTPASGCQDATTSPSASVLFVMSTSSVHRIPRPTSVTIAIRPSCEAGRREVLKMICPTAQARWLRHVGTTGKSVCPTPPKIPAAPAQACRRRAPARPSPQARSHRRSRPRGRTASQRRAPARSGPRECPR